MHTINHIDELMANLQVIDRYLASGKDPEYSFALSLIKKGTCFVVTKSNDSYRFYPSRFIGYINNSMDAHLENDNRDGRETNVAIIEALGGNPLPNAKLEKAYREYCDILGFVANNKGTFGVERKYWLIS